MKLRLLKKKDGLPRLVIDSTDFPYPCVTLCSLPKRLRGENFTADLMFEEPLVERDVDELNLEKVGTPVEALIKLCEKPEIGPKLSEEALLKLYFSFIVAEDPHRRLDVGPITPLAHQVSLVQHITSNQPQLTRVLIGDEVGLGKTIEAGLLIEAFLKTNPGGKVLYLAPARLVPGATRELRRMGLNFRAWLSGVAQLKDIPIGNLTDNLITASIHRACLEQYCDTVAAQRWEMVIVDECHHLSAWDPDGGNPTQKYNLTRKVIENMAAPARVIFLSGTPHQGNVNRFNNLLTLLEPNFSRLRENITGKIIYRLKEDVTDWDGKPLFPKRDVRQPRVIDLGNEMTQWFNVIYNAFSPGDDDEDLTENLKRAKTWRQAQAMQWAASSIEAGLAYLVRQAVRAGLTPLNGDLKTALEAIRPYRGGHTNESVHELFQRINDQVGETVIIEEDDESDDIEHIFHIPNEEYFYQALRLGTKLAQGPNAKAKWEYLFREVLNDINNEKVVLFAQPIETVLAFKKYVEDTHAINCALIVGGQDLITRDKEIEKFRNNPECRFLISSRAGGEGINLQNSRRLVHLDVPWNPMEMEQRVGRVHRFGSTQTIIVETLVLRNSREEYIYTAARRKLHLIADTLGGDEKFDTIYSRVMSLIPPEELAQIIMQNPTGDLTDDDQDRLSTLIQSGFNSWQEFHSKYTEKKKLEVSPGQASWGDVKFIIENHLHGIRLNEFTIPKFYRNEDGSVESSNHPAEVYKIGDEKVSIGDLGGLRAQCSENEFATSLGINSHSILSALRSVLKTTDGAGFIRVNKQGMKHFTTSEQDTILLSFLCTEIKTNANAIGGYEETGTEIKTFRIASDLSYEEISVTSFAAGLRHILGQRVFPRKPKFDQNLMSHAKQLESEIFKKIVMEYGDKRKKVSVYPVAALALTIE